MSYDAIIKALDDHTMSLVGVNVAWPGVHFDPQGEEYVSVSLPGYTRVPTGIGSTTTFRHEGVYQISLHHPSGLGIYPVAEQARQVVEHFSRGLSLEREDGGVVVITGATARPHTAQPSWVMVPVQINWFSEDVSQ